MALPGAPGEEHVDWLVVEPTHKVGQQAQRGVVGPVQVIEKEDARGRTVEYLKQDPHDFPEEATPGARSVERWGRRRVRREIRQVRQQSGCLLHRYGRQSFQAVCVLPTEGGGEAFYERSVGQVLLARVAARDDGGCARGAGAGPELLRAARLSGNRLPLP